MGAVMCVLDAGARCPMEIHLFDGPTAADEFMEIQPEWTLPHRLIVEDHRTPPA